MKRSDFKIKIAEIAQAGLRGLLQNLIAKGENLPDGSIKIPKLTVARWKKLLDVTYYKAPPGDKKWANDVAQQIVDMMEKMKKKEVKKADPPDPRVKEVIETFKEYCVNIRGFNPDINYGRDTIAIKNKLKEFTPDQIYDCFDWFLKDKESTLSPTISTILSVGVFNKFKDKFKLD